MTLAHLGKEFYLKRTIQTHPRYPKSDLNHVATYVATWKGKKGQDCVGMNRPTPEAAQADTDRKPSATVMVAYVGGFAF